VRSWQESHLYAYLGGALSPGAQADLERALGRSDRLRNRLAALEDVLDQVPVPEGVWWIPPPPRHVGPFRPGARPVAELGGAEAGLPAAILRYLGLGPLAEPGRWVAVLLRRGGLAWGVRWPGSARQALPLSAHRADGNRRLLCFSAPFPKGGGRWAVVLQPADWPIDWRASPADRWERLRLALAAGDVPAEAFDLPTAS
jgi:hypothetical protein